jgi:hypothetical protein
MHSALPVFFRLLARGDEREQTPTAGSHRRAGLGAVEILSFA